MNFKCNTQNYENGQMQWQNTFHNLSILMGLVLFCWPFFSCSFEYVCKCLLLMVVNKMAECMNENQINRCNFTVNVAHSRHIESMSMEYIAF